jgi:signal transduction histidine kinase
MKLFLFVTALMITTALQAQPGVTDSTTNNDIYRANAQIQVHELKNYASVFVDSSNKVTINELAAGKFDNRFLPLAGIIPSAHPYITYWLKLSISPSGDIQNWWLLLHDDPNVKVNAQNCYVDGWFVNNARQVMEHQRTGLFVPRSQKSIKENTGLNRIFFSAKAGETKHVYLRIYNEYGQASFSLPELRNPIVEIPHRKEMWMIFVSGGVFLLAVISFFLFVFVRDKSYLFFGLYAVTLSQHYLILHPDFPFVNLYIPEHPHLLQPAFNLLTVGGFILFAFFGRYFINLPQFSKRLNTIFKWVTAFWVICVVVTVTLTIVTHRIGFIEVHYIFLLLFFIYLIRIAFFKSILVRFYLVGALWLIAFSVLGLLWQAFDWKLPFNPWPTGQIGQILIYAAGLAYKVRLNEKARVQAELIKQRNVELAALYEESTKQKEEIEVQKKNAEEALVELKAAQAQLIQNEKMASLGELTAGIAHEIQNPLNFVNNFSEVNTELIEEMKTELKAGNNDGAIAIANDIAENEQKINHHGKRADAIVKGMLQHSRSSSGVKEPTDINALADEYLRLAYHGLRAKDKSFNATMKTDYDETIGNINIIPQDIGRAILNLITNAFYAVTEKNASILRQTQDSAGQQYEPTVSVSTKKLNGKVEIKVMDNGNGIPQKVLDKIFQPFFTTKPTGQGTGLGLSLSYDIITKGHNGELKVETKEGEGSGFIIQLRTT